MKLNCMRSISAYVSIIYHSEYITVKYKLYCIYIDVKTNNCLKALRSNN